MLAALPRCLRSHLANTWVGVGGGRCGALARERALSRRPLAYVPRRQLRKWHDLIKDKVVALMGTDLVRYKDRWAAGVKEIRDIFARLEAEGYTRESQQVRPWLARHGLKWRVRSGLRRA